MKTNKGLLALFIALSALSVSCDNNSSTFSSLLAMRLALDPLANAGVDMDSAPPRPSATPSPSSDTNALFLAEDSEEAIAADAATQSVDCGKQMERMNKSFQLLRPDLDGIQVVTALYLKALFYECNTQQQLAEGAGTLTEKTNGDIITYTYRLDLPDNLLSHGRDKGIRYVTWTDRPDSDLTNGDTAVLLNKYRQKDGVETRTKVEIKHPKPKKGLSEGREITVHYVESKAGNDNYGFYITAQFKEVTYNKGVIGHTITGRVYQKDEDSSKATAYAVRAYSEASASDSSQDALGGAMVQKTDCTSLSSDGFTGTCEFNEFNETVLYYNSEGKKIDHIDDFKAIENGKEPNDTSKDAPGSHKQFLNALTPLEFLKPSKGGWYKDNTELPEAAK